MKIRAWRWPTAPHAVSLLPKRRIRPRGTAPVGHNGAATTGPPNPNPTAPLRPQGAASSLPSAGCACAVSISQRDGSAARKSTPAAAPPGLRGACARCRISQRDGSGRTSTLPAWPEGGTLHRRGRTSAVEGRQAGGRGVHPPVGWTSRPPCGACNPSCRRAAKTSSWRLASRASAPRGRAPARACRPAAGVAPLSCGSARQWGWPPRGGGWRASSLRPSGGSVPALLAALLGGQRRAGRAARGEAVGGRRGQQTGARRHDGHLET